MAKVFIPFLGVNKYSKVIYVYTKPYKEPIETQTKFVQVASVRSLCEGWTDKDRIIIFRTKGSDKANWIDNPEKGEGLKTELSNLLKPWKDHGTVPTLNPGEDENPGKYIVPNGFNQEELWGIFNKVFDNINEGDEIYFDMTHAFRTIPLFTTVLFNYCRFMKGSAVKEVLYGAFEALSDQYDLRNMKPEDKEQLKVQLVDLTEVIRLQDVNEAVSSFKQFGDMGSIIKILEGERRNNASNPNASPNLYLLNNTIFEIQKALRHLNLYTQTCNLKKLYEGTYIESIYELIGRIEGSENIPDPQKELLKEIRKELEESGFTNQGSHKNIEAAVKWLIRNNMIQQAVTLASEYIKETYFRLYDIFYLFPDEIHKNNVKNSISFILSNKKNFHNGNMVFEDEGWESKLEERAFDPEDVMDFIQIESVYSIQPHYENLRKLRNKMNHADDVGNTSLSNLRNNFENEIWNNCLVALGKIYEGEDITMEELWPKNA